MCIHLLLHELKVEEINENVGRTDSSYIYIANWMSGIVSLPLTSSFIIVATKKQEISAFSGPEIPVSPTKKNKSVRSCGLQLPKYNSGSDTKRHPGRASRRNPKWPMVQYGPSGGCSPSLTFPVTSAWKLGQSWTCHRRSEHGDASSWHQTTLVQANQKCRARGEVMICK